MNSKQINVVLGVVIVILLGLVGYFSMRNNSQNDTLSQTDTAANADLEQSNINVSQSVSNTQTSQSSTNASQPQVHNEAGSWKETFYNHTLGFSIKYPDNWYTKAYGNDTSVGFAPKNVPDDALVTINYPRQTLAEYKTYHPLLNNPNGQNKLVKEEKVTINSRQWTKLTFRQNESGTIFVHHLTEKDGRVYDIGVGAADPTTVSVYNNMLSTFKFTN